MGRKRKEPSEALRLVTLPNGYSLTVGNETFHYFNRSELLVGLFAHLLVGDADEIEVDSYKELMNLATYMKNEGITPILAVKRKEQEIEELTKRYEKQIREKDSLLVRAIHNVEQYSKRINDMRILAKQPLNIRNFGKPNITQHKNS